MTELLEKAFAEASKLSDLEQNIIANWILAELASEERWEKAFASSEDILGQLADEALDEYHQGKTQKLNPNTL
jgi:hypothetical protein